MAGLFTELRKTLVRAIEILDKAMPDTWPSATKTHVDPVVGEETPFHLPVQVPGYAVMTKRSLVGEIRRRMIGIAAETDPSSEVDYKALHHMLYDSGVLKSMIETAIRHEGLEL